VRLLHRLKVRRSCGERSAKGAASGGERSAKGAASKRQTTARSPLPCSTSPPFQGEGQGGDGFAAAGANSKSKSPLSPLRKGGDVRLRHRLKVRPSAASAGERSAKGAASKPHLPCSTSPPFQGEGQGGDGFPAAGQTSKANPPCPPFAKGGTYGSFLGASRIFFFGTRIFFCALYSNPLRASYSNPFQSLLLQSLSAAVTRILFLFIFAKSS
jgi:hypothetical protein